MVAEWQVCGITAVSGRQQGGIWAVAQRWLLAAVSACVGRCL